MTITNGPYFVFTRFGGADRDWMKDAACAHGHDPETFFPRAKGPHARKAQVKARTICIECPVIAECRDYAEQLMVTDGVWGGKFYNRKALTTSATVPPAPCGTVRAYRGHLRRGEPVDTPCRQAANAYQRSLRA
jgi:WhiB family redox-sensing transcriptional regulator